MSSWAWQGQVSVGPTAQPLTSSRTPARELVKIKAHATNKDPIFVGEVGVTTSNGYPIQPASEFVIGSSSPLTLAKRPWEIYLVGSSGDKASWISLRG